MRIVAPLVLSVVAVGCGGAAWTPKDPTKPDYPQVVDVASRVRDPLPDCSSIGLVHADRYRGNVVPTLARGAAEHGGTHYKILGDNADSEVVTNGASTSTRYIWATVYRCMDDVHTPSGDSD